MFRLTQLLPSIKVRLIDDWHQSWRWSSMRFLALGGAIQAALLAPDRILQYIPTWVLQTASTVSFVCLIAAGLGRVTIVEKRDEHSEPPASGR